MGAIADVVGLLRSAAKDAVDRIRTRLPGVLGRRGASTAVESAVEAVAEPSRRHDRGAGGSLARQSTRRRSSATLENPARFVDPGDAGDAGDAGGDPDPLEALQDRDRPLSDPGDDRENDTLTELHRGDDRTRIVDEDNPDAYVECDCSVALDHMR